MASWTIASRFVFIFHCVGKVRTWCLLPFCVFREMFDIFSPKVITFFLKCPLNDLTQLEFTIRLATELFLQVTHLPTDRIAPN